MLAFFSCLDKSINEMDGKKVYQIEINGIKESIAAVDALNRQLGELENRMKALEKSNVKVNASSSGGGGGSRSSLNEEEKIAKQIEQIDAKRKAYSKDIYQNYLAAKDVLDETVKDQKQISAQERLQANNYTNTMAGLKQELKDLKTVMNGTDIGDDAFKQMAQRANELTTKLKELEASYGQFGRNVGNYQSAFDGLDKLVIEVGGVEREFGSAREAAKTFKNELTALEMQGKGNTAEAKELRKAYNQLKSAMDDATKSSKVMDEAMDWMTSFTAMASVGNGLKAFFGFDDNEITKSIQKLVALQSVLNGIENIRKQMDTGKGIGAILSKGSQGVDKFVASITGAQLGVEGLTKGSRLATVAVRSLSIAMKGLGIGLIITAISGLVEMVQKASTAIQDYFKGNAELMDSSHLAKSSIEAENNALQKQRDILSSKFMRGYIDETEYARENMIALTEAIQDNINKIDMQASVYSKFKDQMKDFKDSLIFGFGKDGLKVSSDMFDVTAIIKNIDEARAAWELFSRAVEKGVNIYDIKGASSLSEWLSSFVVTADDAKDDLVQIGQIIAGDWVRNISTLSTTTDEGKKKLNELVTALDNDKILHTIMMNLDKYFPDEKVIAQIQNLIKYAKELNNAFQFDKEASKEGAEYWAQVRIDAMKNGADKVRAQIELDKKKEISELEKYGSISAEHLKQINEKYNRKLIEQTKQFGQQQRDAQNDLINLRIQLMKEGFEKEKAQLEQERKERIQKVVQSGILVGERTVAINNLYDKKIADAKKKWAADILKTYQDLYQSIQELNRATFNMEGDNAQMNVENKAAQNKQNAGYSLINPTTFDDSKTLEEYYRRVLEIEKKASDEEARIRQERLDKELEYNKQEEKLRHARLANAENGEYKQQLETGKITQEQYDKLMEDENAAHYARMNTLDKEYAAQSTQVVKDQLEEQQRLYNQYYNSIISDIKKDKQKVDEIMTKQPVVDTNGWNVVNTKKTSENYKTALSQYEKLKKDIINKQFELDEALKAKRISPEDFAMRQSELKDEMKAIDEAVKNVKDRQKQLVADFVQSLMPYIQAAVDSVQNILSAVWDAQDNAFEKEQDDIDKLTDALDKKLSEQEALLEQHKSAVDSIEDELANSRGSRRQHLIDQLNAEMAAERAAAKQKQKIEKEQEKAQKRQDALDLKRKKAQYKRDLTQAIVNGAMAVTYAAINAWPIPAVPMMALAAATTAAQIAIMSANKPYAKGGQLEGGVAQGKRHRDGGIPVLGGRASIEGGEFITNRVTTQKNVEVLDFINSKHKKLTLDDFVDFYGGSKVRNNIISSTPKRVFEDGGVIPTLRNDYGIDDRLLTAIEYYNNRPVVVSVVDINKKQADVRRVQTLAGL